MSFRNDDKEELTRLLAKVDVEVGDSKDVVNDHNDTPAKEQPPASPASRRTRWSILGFLLVSNLFTSLVFYPWLLHRKGKQSIEDTSAAHLDWPLMWDDGHHHEHGHHRHPRILNGKPAEHIFL